MPSVLASALLPPHHHLPHFPLPTRPCPRLPPAQAPILLRLSPPVRSPRQCTRHRRSCSRRFITKVWTRRSLSGTNLRLRRRLRCTRHAWRRWPRRTMRFRRAWCGPRMRWKAAAGKRCPLRRGRRSPSFLEARYTLKKIGSRCTL